MSESEEIIRLKIQLEAKEEMLAMYKDLVVILQDALQKAVTPTIHIDPTYYRKPWTIDNPTPWISSITANTIVSGLCVDTDTFSTWGATTSAGTDTAPYWKK